MKNMNIKYILSGAIMLSVLAFSGTALAADPSLQVSPLSADKTVGDSFDAVASVSASDSKVCLVEGTVVFDSLTCKSITTADGLAVQTAPTCSNPYFLIGIPGCTTSGADLFTISAEASQAGKASISFSSVDLVGEGSSVGSSSFSGIYTVSAPAAAEAPVVEHPVVEEQPVVTTQNSAPAEEEPVVTEENNAPAEEEPTIAPSSGGEQPAETAGEASQASLANVSASGSSSTLLWIFIIALVLLAAWYFIYYRPKKKKAA